MWHPFPPKTRNVPHTGTRVVVTLGVSFVTFLTLMWPELASLYGVLALAFITNLIWIWR